MYKQLKLWKEYYARKDYPDKRALEDFITCETEEVVKSLQLELSAIKRGQFDPEILDQLIGRAREDRHGSYEEWAGLMLLWIANVRR